MAAENTSFTPQRDALALAWFCLWCSPKHEHIAAAHLRQSGAANDVFLPRIRFRRPTKRGPAWVTEALFPNYLFAQFDWQRSLRHVQSIRGVRGVVHFGQRWPTIPEEAIAGLRAVVSSSELFEVPTELAPGDTVRVAQGAFSGLLAVVAKSMPGKERVLVLMEFLGRQTTIELAHTDVILERDGRRSIL